MSNCVGVDISFWSDTNSTPQMYDPWKTRAQGGSFVGIKTSQANWADPDFLMNWKNCENILYRIPYHFLVWDVKPRTQAEFFWGMLEKSHKDVLPLVVDFEWWSTVPSAAMDILYNFLERMKQLTSLPLGIYTAKSFWDYYGSSDPCWTQYALWLCDISSPTEIPKPWSSLTFHQYTFKLNGPLWGAESLDLDGDYYNGTLQDMMKRYSLSPLQDSNIPPAQTKKYFIPYYNDLNVRSSPDTTVNNKVARTVAGGSNIVLEEKFSGGYNWIKTENWMATDGFGEFVTK